VSARGRAAYETMFERLRSRGEGAFVPFVVLGDPNPATSLALIRTLVRSGADALELGLPFSDPVADGPVVQAASTRALGGGVRIADCWKIVRAVRTEFPATPMGMLVYSNLVLRHGAADFYRRASDAGADSVLVADAPILESAPLEEAAREARVAPVLIAPPNASDATLSAVASRSEGYVYVVTRPGVTGVDERLRDDSRRLIATLNELGAAPPMLGFGISKPTHVRAALDMGAAGAISGSAVVSHIPRMSGKLDQMLEAVGHFVREMKEASKPR